MNSGYEAILMKLLGSLPSLGIIAFAVIMFVVYLLKIGLHFREDLDALKAAILRIEIKLGLREGTPEDQRSVVASRHDLNELKTGIRDDMRDEFRSKGECDIAHQGIYTQIESLDHRIDRKQERLK